MCSRTIWHVPAAAATRLEMSDCPLTPSSALSFHYGYTFICDRACMYVCARIYGSVNSCVLSPRQQQSRSHVPHHRTSSVISLLWSLSVQFFFRQFCILLTACPSLFDLYFQHIVDHQFRQCQCPSTHVWEEKANVFLLIQSVAGDCIYSI